MSKKKVKMILPSAFAKKHKVSYPAVMKWIRRKLIPFEEQWEPIHHYLIPENAPRPATTIGRPMKPTVKKPSKG